MIFNIQYLIKKKKEEFHGLIDDETAFLLVLKDLGVNYPPRLIDLFEGFPVKELNVKVLKKISDGIFKVYEICDTSAKARLITKKNIEEGSFIKILNPRVRRNKYITLFSDTIAPGEKFNIENIVHYTGEFIVKVISSNELLTDSFYIIECNHSLEVGKYYHVKILFSEDPEILFSKELSLEV